MPAYSPAQVDRAYELVDDHGIAPAGDGLYVAVSSDGSSRYVVDLPAGTCTCPATKPCYHLLAADMVQVEVETGVYDDEDLADEDDEWDRAALDHDFALDRWEDLYA